MTDHPCESCGMSISNGKYCPHCLDAEGNLQTFEERFARMMQWTMKENPQLSKTEAERKTRAYMRTMPAWKNHSKLDETS